jgi:hypothetical protein
MLRIPAQRASATDRDGRVSAPWWQFLSDMARSINSRTSSSVYVTSSHTGDTAEYELAIQNIAIGNLGTCRVLIATSSSSTANIKTVRIKSGGTTLQTFLLDPSTDTQTLQIYIAGRGASSQYVTNMPSVNATGSGGAVTSVDLSITIPLSVTVELSNAADTVTLESFIVEVQQ